MNISDAHKAYDKLFENYFKNLDTDYDLDNLEKSSKINNLPSIDEDLDEIRQDNYEKYYSINIDQLSYLPNEFSTAVDDILSTYKSINPYNFFEADFNESLNTRLFIDSLDRKIYKLNNMIKTTLKELKVKNEQDELKLNKPFFDSLNLNEQTKKDMLKKREELDFLLLEKPLNLCDELVRENMKRSIINDINNKIALNKVELDNQNKNILNELNAKINEQISLIKDKIVYLEDILPTGSKYLIDFNNFKEFFNKIIAYDDQNYDNTKQTYDLLTDKEKILKNIKTFEELFLNEISSKNKEEKFIYENIGIKNLKKSLDYITSNYMDILSPEEKSKIQSIFEEINSNNFNLEKLEKDLETIVSKIWSISLTDISHFNNNEDYSLICSNNPFIDEKYETILITKRELSMVDNYKNYQIGFVCSYYNNILYITENDDIMSVDYNDMSKLKTPAQIEQEFINFKVCNKIALNGYLTKLTAVYFINDGDLIKYNKAFNLAREYNLPLIVLKK